MSLREPKWPHFLALGAALVVLGTGVGSLLIRPSTAAVGRVAYGEWNPNWQQGSGVNNAVITSRDADMGHPLDIVHWYASDTEGYADYDHVMVDNALALGRTPFVSWGLPIPYSNDANLDDWANGIKAKAPAQVYIRLFWEFNDVPTSTNATWGVCQSSRTPAQLVSTWRHVVDRFRADGATNVRWVWNPDGTSGSQMYGSQCGSLSTAYPGDAYVDFRGFDSYGYDNQQQYDNQNAQAGSSRPMLLGEFGGTDASGGVAWINDLSARLNSGSMTQVQAVVYFNELDTRFAINPNTKAAVKSMLQTAAFRTVVTPSPSPSVTPSPTPSPTSSARIDVYARGSANDLIHRSWTSAGGWTAWESLGGVMQGNPAAVSWGPNRSDVFVRGTDDALWHRAWTGTTWSSWESLGGGQIDSPAATSRGTYLLDVFLRGLDGGLWIDTWNGSRWSGWNSLGGGAASSGPAASAWGGS